MERAGHPRPRPPPTSSSAACHNAELVMMTNSELPSTARCCGRRRASSDRQRARVLAGVKARRSAPPRLRGAHGLDAGSAHARPDWLLPTMPNPDPLHVVVDELSRMTPFPVTVDNDGQQRAEERTWHAKSQPDEREFRPDAGPHPGGDVENELPRAERAAALGTERPLWRLATRVPDHARRRPGISAAPTARLSWPAGAAGTCPWGGRSVGAVASAPGRGSRATPPQWRPIGVAR